MPENVATLNHLPKAVQVTLKIQICDEQSLSQIVAGLPFLSLSYMYFAARDPM